MLEDAACHVDGTMASPRTADADRQAFAPLFGVTRQEKIKEIEETRQEWLQRRVGRYESGRCVIIAGERLQTGNIVRVA